MMMSLRTKRQMMKWRLVPVFIGRLVLILVVQKMKRVPMKIMMKTNLEDVLCPVYVPQLIIANYN